MKRMNFPLRKLKRRAEAEARNAKTPLERTKRHRKSQAAMDKLAAKIPNLKTQGA